MKERAVKIINTRTVILTVLVIFFFGLLIYGKVPVYNDSDQYIKLHLRREPVYPVFLFLIRCIFRDAALVAAGIIQTLISVACAYRFVIYLTGRFKLNSLCTAAVCAFTLLPYIVTPFVSRNVVMLAGGIMSESIAIPLFLLFFVHTHRMLCDREIPDAVISFLLAFVLSLTRSNLMILLIAWIIAAATAFFPKKRIVLILLWMGLFVLSFPARSLLTKTYNYAFNGRFVGNAYTRQTALVNVFYVTEREMGESIDDPELREIFYTLWDDMDASQKSYHYSEGGAYGRAARLEDMHDRIKFEVIEYGLRDIIEARGIHDYVDYNLIAEDYCGKLLPILFKGCALRWFEDYLILGIRGLSRSIAVCHPVAFVYVALAVATAVFLCVMLIKRKKTDAAWLGMLSLLLLFGNAFGTAAIIMCLSRYMIYVFAPFYASMLVMVYKMWYDK